MKNRLRNILFSTPVLTAMSLFVLYLVCGFLALPAIVRWQIEQQAPEMLGHHISIGALRFNPLSFRLDADDLVLADGAGSQMLSVKRLLVDFKLGSLVDRAWTITQTTVEEPTLYVSIDKNGHHNFTALLDRLRELKSGKNEDPLLPIVIQRFALADGRVEFADRRLDEPLVARIETLRLEVDNLSTLPARTAQYRLSARTAGGESLQASGDLALNPLAASGRLALKAIKLDTLAKGLSHLAALDSHSERIDFAAKFELALDRQGALSASARDIDLELGSLSIKAPGGEATVETLSLTQGRVDFDRHEASFGGLRLANGRIAASINSAGDIDRATRVRAAAAPPRESTAPSPWRVSVANADIANIALAFNDATTGRSLSVDSVDLKLAASADFGPAATRIELRKPKLSIANARLKAGADSIDLLGATLTGDTLSLARNKRRLQIAGDAARPVVSGLSARQGSGRFAAEGVEFEARAVSASAGGASAPGFQAHLEDATLRLTSAGVVAHGSSTELAQVSNANLGAASLLLTIPDGLPDGLPDGMPDVLADGLTAELTSAVVRNSTDMSELLRLDSAKLSGGSLNLRAQRVAIDGLSLSKGRLQTGLDAQGGFNWLGPMAGAATPAVAAAESPRTSEAVMPPAAAMDPASVAQTVPWRISLGSVAVDGLAVGFEDRRESPPLAVGLEEIRARISAIDTAPSAKPMRIDFHAKLVGGGQVGANGEVRADNGKSNLKVTIAEVPLAPLQSYLSQFADLRIAGGTLSAVGRLRYGDQAGAGARLAYDGRIAVEQAVLEEVEPPRPFLAWDSIASDDMVLTLWPHRVDIGELRVEHPSGRLIIGEDQTTNLMDLRKRPKEHETATAQNAAPDDGFPVAITRVRVSGGVIEFSDLSLRPPFGVRMHELHGVVTGLGSDANRHSKLQLEARVGEYGAAKIGGQIDVARPTQFTEIDMAFRNLEMTSLSPYVAKFAGYRVASGRLALDLRYRVKDNKLVGENKIVLKQVELGEKVQSPDAIDLPLELAIAILKDADGVIDVDLPVTGDLGDPQFAYGALIGKAFGSLLGGIVSAPFRAIAALFGSTERNLDTIDFEPGRDVLAPPERQKLATVARALKERPALMLGVPPTYAVNEDAAALKSLALRNEILKRMGIELPAGEDPGPIDPADPRARKAIEAAFRQRYAPEVLDALKQRADGSTTGAAGASSSATRQPDTNSALYQGLLDRLIAETPISDQALTELAVRRGAAVKRELTTVGGVSAARVVLGETRRAPGSNEKAVALQLELEVAK